MPDCPTVTRELSRLVKPFPQVEVLWDSVAGTMRSFWETTGAAGPGSAASESLLPAALGALWASGLRGFEGGVFGVAAGGNFGVCAGGGAVLVGAGAGAGAGAAPGGNVFQSD
jgi:hypothetical protein